MRAFAMLLLMACAHSNNKPCLTKTPPELHGSFIGPDEGCPHPVFAMCLTDEQTKDLIRQLAAVETWVAYAWKTCGDGSEPPPRSTTSQW